MRIHARNHQCFTADSPFQKRAGGFIASAQTINQIQVDYVLAEAIRASRSILDLEDDWDEEGSPCYRETTWNRAAEFIKDVASTFHQRSGVWVDPPKILPGPEGSIDIHWKTSNRELLINIPDDSEEPAGYYGCGDPKDTVKGKLDTSLTNEWILIWLTR